MEEIIYRYHDKVYFNITNRCPCRCTFCIRNTPHGLGPDHELWLEKEPSLEEIKKAIDEYDFGECKEVVFCGYGEPLMALEKLIWTSGYLKERFGFRIRVDTNGLGDLIHGRPVAKELCQAVDAVSISLNMPDADSYNQVVRPDFGKKSFHALLSFAADCRKYLEDVRFTVVDVIGEEAVENCRKLAESVGIPLRVRKYSE